MYNFTLNLKKQSVWTGILQWWVYAHKEYSSATDRMKPKFDDSMFSDVLVERIIRRTGQKEKVSAKVDPSKFFELIEVAYHIRIPLIGIDFPKGDDGTDYEVTFWTLGKGNVEIKWWSSYPKEWEPLAKWFSEITTFLDDAIENKAL